MKTASHMDRLPALVLPPGAPTFALQAGEAGVALARFAQRIKRPSAILIVSAHWETAVPTLGSAAHPATLHDFYGFPEALYKLRYDAPGAVELALKVRHLLQTQGFTVALDDHRGFDHGAWIPLRLMYPQADIPVLTLSVQPHLGPLHHYRMGQALSTLVDFGVLVAGSGNLTHNLMHYQQLHGASKPPDYVAAFQGWVWERLQASDNDALVDYRRQAPGAVPAHPTDEHLLPLHFALGAAGEEFNAERVYSGVEHNMLAMDSFAFWSIPPHQQSQPKESYHV